MVKDSADLTFDSIPPFTVGDTVLVTGAADSTGADLSGKVVSASGTVLTLDTVAGATVTDALVSKRGIIVDSTATNVFNLPGQLPGQVVDSSSVQVLVNQAKVETLASGFAGYPASNKLDFFAASSTGDVTSGNATIASVADVTSFRIGDSVVITGAGVSGADLTATVLDISGNNLTISVAPSTTVSATAITKTEIANVNSVTSTLVMEAGDEVSLEYVDNTSTPRTFSSTVLVVVAVSGISSVTLADMLPANVSQSTTASGAIAASSSTLSLTSATGFVAGDTILIKGAGASGSDHEAVIGSITGSTISGLSPVTVTAVDAGAVVVKKAKVTLKTRKLFNNQLVPAAKPITSGSNYVTSNIAVDGTVTINPNPEVIYGKIISGTVHMAYKALRTDLSSSVLAIEQGEVEGTLGEISEDNPLALGVSTALANTTTRVRAIAISSNDSQGFFDALELAEGERVYGLVPMTQDQDVCQAFALHAQQMSTAEEAAWRVALVNTKIPTKTPVGQYTDVLVNANGGNNNITVASGKYVLTSSNSTFINDGVTPGDILNVTAGTGSPSPVGTMQVLEVVSNQQIVVQAQGVATGVSFYITRTLTKTQRAAAAAAVSKTFGSNRVIHIQPDTVAVNVDGRKVIVPGYYLACAVSGLVAGMPAQQGFTNMGIAGVSDLYNSNFYFTRAQMNAMAEAGTFLFVQETTGSLPYVRHELTTDMSVLEYRELQQVKNWDFVSYFFLDKLKAFIGKWNITEDTIGTIRQTINASSEMLKAQKLPRIGAPLLSAVIDSLAQNATNQDNLDCRLTIKIPKTLNYLNLYLVI
jgi:hypothetical protein